MRLTQEAAANQNALIAENGRRADEASAKQFAYMEQQSLAAKESANKQAQDQRDAAQASQQAREMEIGRQAALAKAQEMTEQKKQDSVEVTLASDTKDQAEIDPETGRRRPVRASFMSNSKSTSGITL
jgi:hypothetical protein